MDLAFLGTGCDYATPEREPACVLVRRPLNILLDCPPPILKQLAAVNMSPLDIDAVCVSHRHGGHSLGMPFLLWGNVVLGRRRDLTVFMPDDPVLDQLSRMWEEGLYAGEVRKRKMFESRFEKLNPSEPSTRTLNEFLPSVTTEARGDVFLHSAPLRHWEKEEKGLATLGYRLEFTGLRTSIAYVTDTEPCESAVQLARTADVLIHDASFENDAVEWARNSKHSTAREAGEIAKKAGARLLALIHLHATRFGRKDIRDLMLSDARQTFDGPVIFPDDLDIVDLGAYNYHRPPYTVRTGPS